LLDITSGLEKSIWRLNELSSSVAFSPDGKFLVDARGRLSSMWNLETEQEIARFARDGATSEDKVRFSPDGRIVAISGSRAVTLWGVTALQPGNLLE
jgi:WD40 repeat protein